MIKSNRFSETKTFLEKIKSIDYILLAVILLIGIISCFVMYSTDGGQFEYHTNSHILKFSIFFVLFIMLSFVRVRFWFITSYLFYFVILGMLVYVLLFGMKSRYVEIFKNFQESRI